MNDGAQVIEYLEMALAAPETRGEAAAESDP